MYSRFLPRRPHAISSSQTCLWHLRHSNTRTFCFLRGSNAENATANSPWQWGHEGCGPRSCGSGGASLPASVIVGPHVPVHARVRGTSLGYSRPPIQLRISWHRINSRRIFGAWEERTRGAASAVRFIAVPNAWPASESSVVSSAPSAARQLKNGILL